MYAWPFKWEQYRHLHRGERRLLFDHLKRLSEKDLHERFQTYVDSNDLLAHVNRDAPEHETIGWFCKGMLRGAIETFYGDQGAEAGLTIEPKWRGQGVGTELVRRALSSARDKGMMSLNILGHHSNYPLLVIAARFGAMETAARNHLVKGLLPIDDDRVIRFSFDLRAMADEPHSGLLRRTFSYLRS